MSRPGLGGQSRGGQETFSLSPLGEFGVWWGGEEGQLWTHFYQGGWWVIPYVGWGSSTFVYQRVGTGGVGYPGWGEERQALGAALRQSTVLGLTAVGQPHPALWVEMEDPT